MRSGVSVSYFLVVGHSERDAASWQEFGQSCRFVLGENFDLGDVLSPPGPGNTLVVTWKKGGVDDVQFVRKGSMWGITSGQVDATDVGEFVKFKGGVPCLVSPIWGRYVAVVGSVVAKSVHGWQTSPAMESLNYGFANGVFFASNSPLLVSLARCFELGERLFPSYSSDALRQYLAYGYTVAPVTMFAGVSQVPPRCVVNLDYGAYASVTSGPSGQTHSLAESHSLQEAGEALSESLSNSFLRATADIKGPIDMRVSGGKDSRIMIGLAKRHGTPVVATCVGSGKDADSRVARHLVNEAGFEFICRNAPAYDATNPWYSTKMSLRAMQGIPRSVAHFAPNAFTDPAFPGQTLMFGNWPAYHGVYHRRMRYTLDEAMSVMKGIVSPLVSGDARAETFSELQLWLDRMPAQNTIQQLYEFGLYFRGSNWMKSGFTGWVSKYNCAFFMSDQELTSLADSLTMFEHISYSPEFIALREIWPDAVRVPLADDVWRFEAYGAADDSLLDPEGYRNRVVSLDELFERYPAFEPTRDEAGMRVFEPKIISEIVEYLNASATYHSLIAPLIDDRFVDAVNDGTDMSRNYERFLWRVFSLTCAVNMSWFSMP